MHSFLKPAALALAALVASPASATTFNIFLGSGTTTFDAPSGGGAISNFSITVSGITFDTAQTGSSTPVYNAANRDIRGAASQFGGFTNSTASGGCPVGSCVLAFESSIALNAPKNWLAFMVGSSGNIANGTYTILQIAPPPGPVVPLPAPILFLASGVAALAFAGRRKARARA